MVKLNSGFHTRGGDKLIIRISDSRVFSVIAKSILLAFAILTFPWFGSTLLGTSSTNVSSSSSSSSSSSDDATWMLSTLFKDLTTEGLLQSNDKALFVNGGKTMTPSSEFLNEYNQMDLISESDIEHQSSSIPDETFDFVFTSGFQFTGFIDRTLKTGGIVTIRLSDNPSNTFKRPTNYKIVYIRRFESTIVAMKKTQPSLFLSHEHEVAMNSNTNRKLLEFVSEAKKEALNGLEGVLLEPPRAASEKLRTKYMKRTKYLPDIMGDSLDGYPRRVFIDVGSPGSTGGGTGWFEMNYPTRNRDFKKYQIETVSTEEEEMMVKGKKVIPQIGMSEWLRKNVKEEEYVVMKAEAEVVEEMVNGKAIGLVDELFMECKYQGLKGKKGKSRRAYWECLALYGRLRDEGVAVHQWWGS